MSKYSEEFKLKVVLDYLNGTQGYKLMAKKYHVKAESQVRRWVRAYKEFNRNGISGKNKKATYPVQFKLNNPSLIAN